MRRRPRPILVCLGFTLLGLISPRAEAYVRTQTSLGVPVSWKNPCIEMRIILGAPPPLLTADQYLAAAQRAAGVWSHDELACSDIRLSIIEDPAEDAPTGNDGQSLILFRQDDWCPRGDNPNAGCYPANALAITTLWRNPKTGEIPEADIEINAVANAAGNAFLWNDLATTPGQGIDFQNMLTHELGHVLGFSHNCYTASDREPSLVDHTGAATLGCYDSALPAAVAEATMFPSVDRADLSRRTLSPDDQQAVCEVYPYTHEACPVPAPAPTGGCALGRGSSTGFRAFGMLIILVLGSWWGGRLFAPAKGKNHGLRRAS